MNLMTVAARTVSAVAGLVLAGTVGVAAATTVHHDRATPTTVNHSHSTARDGNLNACLAHHKNDPRRAYWTARCLGIVVLTPAPIVGQ